MLIPALRPERFLTSLGVASGYNELEVFIAFVLATF